MARASRSPVPRTEAQTEGSHHTFWRCDHHGPYDLLPGNAGPRPNFCIGCDQQRDMDTDECPGISRISRR
jgi:hypothetical protein